MGKENELTQKEWEDKLKKVIDFEIDKLKLREKNNKWVIYPKL